MTDAGGTISVKLFAGLELRAREPRASCESDPREIATVAAVAQAIGLDPAAGLILVSGVHASRDQAPGPHDEVALFPPPGGG